MKTIPITSVLVIDRQRHDYGNVEELATSMRELGLIQPIVLNQENRLIAGGRRLAAATLLGWKEIPVVYKETLTADELHILELEENVQRKEMEWQEKCLCIYKIHTLKQKRGALDGNTWGQRETGSLLGLSAASINYCLAIARYLQQDTTRQGEFWSCDCLDSAWSIIKRKAQEEREAELARRQREMTNSGMSAVFAAALVAEVTAIESRPDLLVAERERYYSNSHNPPGSFEEYWNEKKAKVTEIENTIYLSTRLILGDSIKYMLECPNYFDHIVTDIPYGIDMEMLEQENTGMDVSSVEEEHDVDANMDLIDEFFLAAWSCTRSNAFVITWCDQAQWQYMYDLATSAGFAVQRWPLTWVKAHTCMNQAAQYNFTKTTEIAMVCRKPGATLVKTMPTSVITASNMDMRKRIGHPFAKPFECWDFPVSAISIEGQTILDPFCGRGSSILSLMKLKRNFVGVELNVSHYNALLENVKQEYLKLNPKFVFQ